MSRAGVLRALFRGVIVSGVVAWTAPWLLFATTAPFPGRLAATVAFFAVVSEKLWSSVLRMPGKVAIAPDKDWTAVAVGWAYAAVTFTILAEVYVRQVGLAFAPASAIGAALYLAGLLLKYASLRRLGAAWSIQLDQAAAPDAVLVRAGPYRYVRHPVYLAAMLDTVGFALLFASPWALAVALLAFCPAELARARFEETYLRPQFGAAYDAYAREVPAFFPSWRRGGRPRGEGEKK